MEPYHHFVCVALLVVLVRWLLLGFPVELSPTVHVFNMQKSNPIVITHIIFIKSVKKLHYHIIFKVGNL